MGSIEAIWRIHSGLPVITDMFNHRREIGRQVDEKLSDLVQTPFDRVKARGCRFMSACDWLSWYRRPETLEHRFEMLWFPAERHRERFQGSRATVALNGVTLNFAHNSGRHVRALSKFALAPSKLGHALIDGFRDGRPILRHPIPPRSAFGAEISGSASFCGTSQGLPRRHPPNTSASRAEIIEISLKSATMARSAGFAPSD